VIWQVRNAFVDDRIAVIFAGAGSGFRAKYHTNQQGMSVQITLKSLNKTVSGTVSEISKSAANTGGQYMVKINIHNAADLLPGMFVNVQFPTKSSGKSIRFSGKCDDS
jgi:multidrug efflux pump subunit AcrA (membrane-fusion protein)